MSDILRSEALKTLTTRANIVLLVGAMAVLATATASTVLSMPPGNLNGPIHEQVAYFIGSIVVALFALIVGVRGFTDEFRHGTIVSTVLLSPARSRLLLAKGIVAVGVALVMSVLGLATLLVVAVSLGGVKGGDLAVAGSDWAAFAGFVGAMMCWAVLGTGLGAMVRNQTAGIVGALVWVLVVESFASGFLGDVARFMPGQLAHGMAQANAATNPLGPLPALGIFAGYVLIICLGAALMLDRRDVN